MNHLLDVRRLARVVSRLTAVATVVATAACSEDPARLVAPRAAPGPQGTVRTMLVCTATTHQAGSGSPSVTCTPVGGASRMLGGAVAGGGPRADIIRGRQNIDVTLAVNTFAFNAVTNIFSFTATVKNLMVQPIGTTNGTTVAGNGVQVFFVAGPSVSQGTGVVTTIGTSLGTFTASNQAYYKYAQIIKPDSVSAGQTWQFLLAPTVSSFNFSVEIAAAAPAEKSVTRWTSVRQGVNSNQLNAVWQDATNDVWAVGLKGTVLHYDGTSWSPFTNGLTRGYPFHGISGSSASDLWAVADGGAALHSNGSAWTLVTTGTVTNLYAVWERASNDVYAVGGAAKILHYNGTAWSAMTAPAGVTDTLRAVWGSDASHVFAAGDNSRILFYNGTTWTSIANPGPGIIRGLWGSSASNVFAVGDGATVLKYNGTTWSTMTPDTVTSDLHAVGGSSASDVWAVGVGGTTVHYDGTRWTAKASRVGLSLHGVTSGTVSPVWAVGDAGALVSFNGSKWALSDQSGLPIKSIWASSATDIWATTLGTILHYDGTTWTSAYVSAADTMFALWGFSSTDVHALGSNGNVAIWDGSTWALHNINAGGGFAAEWGAAAGSLCAVGANAVVCNGNGGATSPAATQLTSIWGTSATTHYTTAVNGAIYKTNDHASSWATMNTPAPAESLYAVFGTGGTAIWAAGQAGTIYTNTGTNTWTAQTSNTTTTLRHLWAGAAPTGYTADVYAVGDNGTVQHYNGSFWINMPTHTTANLRAVFGTSATNVYIGGDNGVVLIGTQ